MTQNQNRPVRPADSSRSAYRADPVTRMRSHAKGFLRGIPKDVWRIAVIGLAVIVLAGFAQVKWPNGFPLTTDRSTAAQAVTQVYAAGAIRINEIMTANARTISSPSGVWGDWVEIINTGSSAVNLQGWSLAKKSNSPAFTFPDCTLQPDACVLVFCDGIGSTEGGAYGAPFRLSADGDSLMLFNASGTAVDTVNIPALGKDISYVRMDTSVWQKTSAATPGMANTQENYEARYRVSATDVIEITEVMASNAACISDCDGEFSDYIELHNTSAADVDLTGYYLSDDVQNAARWRFPETVIPAGGYIVVFASGKNKSADGELHTNFKLRSEGEQAVLSNPQGQIIQIVDYGILKKDQAYSKTADGMFTTGLTPTPGEKNT